MLIGNIESFGIEYTLDKDYGGEWLFGKMCYWIGGQRVGNYDLGTSLRDVLFQMKYVLHYCHRRSYKPLCETDTKEAFMIIDSALYGDSGNIDNSAWQDVEVIAFDIRIPVDIFDEWKIYLIDCERDARLIYKNNSSADVVNVALEIGHFDNVLAEFNSQLVRIYNKEASAIR